MICNSCSVVTEKILCFSFYRARHDHAMLRVDVIAFLSLVFSVRLSHPVPYQNGSKRLNVQWDQANSVTVVKFELFELYHWLELYELYYKHHKVHKVKMQNANNCVHNYKYGKKTTYYRISICELNCNLYDLNVHCALVGNLIKVHCTGWPKKVSC